MQLDAQLTGRGLGGLAPDPAAMTGEQGQTALAADIQRRHPPALGIMQPGVGQARAGPGGGVVIQFAVSCIGRLFAAIIDDR
ncbi:hypothetical protein D3C79_997480 [compost metagenome]